MQKKRLEFLLSMAWGAVVACLTLLLFFIPTTAPAFLSRLNNYFDDAYQRSDARASSRQIALVGWDERTTDWLTDRGGGHEEEYRMMGRAIANLKAEGAAVIAVDIVPVFQTPYDKTFAGILRRCGNVVLGTLVGTYREGSDILSVSYQADNPVISPAAPFAYINLDPDGDGVLRSLRLYPSYSPFAVSAALRYEKARYGAVSRDYWPYASNLTLPVRFYKNPEKLFHLFSMRDAMEGKLPHGAVAGKLVFIGYSDNSFAQDEHNTPVGEEDQGESYNLGMAIHAMAADDLIEGTFLRPAPLFWQALALTTLILIVAAVTSAEKKGRGLWAALLSISACFYVYFFSQYLEHSRGILLNTAGFLFGIVVCYAAVFIRRQVLVEGQSALIHEAFTHYVGQQVLNELLGSQNLLAPQGAKKELTLLFADIRGFTTISETQEPEAVMEQLREFFEAMGLVVMDNGGYINKFLGDGFLVLFGLSGDKYHAWQALTTARQMLIALGEKNERWRGEGKPELSIGVGVHTGDVLWGNVGSAAHLEFTVIGDAVNLASRIQDLTKNFPDTPILLSESTLKQILETEKDFPYRDLGEVSVRGRKAPIRLFGMG